MDRSHTIDALRNELEALERELQRLEARRARERENLQTRIDLLAEHAASESHRSDRLRATIAALESDLAAAHRERERVEHDLRHLEAGALRRERVVQRQADELERRMEFVRVLREGLLTVTGDVERIGGSRAWRLGHGIANTRDRLLLRHRVTTGAVDAALARLYDLERATAALDLQPAGRVGPAAAVTTPTRGVDAPERAALAQRIRRQLGPVPRRRRWPLVSILVLNRNGEGHLRRLLPGLIEQTDYPRRQLIVVDNASEDGSVAYLRGLELSFPLQIIENTENVSFSAGNNQAARLAQGKLLLLLNNDIEPFEPGWLRELVTLASGKDVGAAGATLLHGFEFNDGIPAVQHRGVKLRYRQNRMQPYNLEDGGQLFDRRFGVDVAAPVTTGACLMIDRALYESLGGLNEQYAYGTEDVELGLSVIATGAKVLTSGRSHLLHRESSTQDALGRAFKRENRLNNQRVFAQRWGSKLRREYILDRIEEAGYFSEGEAPHLAITLTSLDQADGWGDWYTGHELGDALERIGWTVTHVQRKDNEWYELPDGLDYIVVLLDSYDLRNVSTDALKIAWIRSWTERWLEHPWFGCYDMVLASSRPTTELVRQRAGMDSVYFPLATNPDRFRRVEPSDVLTSDYVFTGNYWQRERSIQGLAPKPGETLKVFGSGWEDVPALAPYAHGALPYSRLAEAYSSAKLVVDDTALHTLPYGAVNSRVFDALATGTLVLTNCASGVRELFDDDFPVWENQASLRARLDELLADDERRQLLADRYRDVVLERHTYDVRARQLAAALAAAERRLTFCIKTGAPSWQAAPEWGDVHYGGALARELRRRGHRALVQVLSEWEDPAGLRYDVVIHLKGLSRYTPVPGQFNVLWCISHPDQVTVEECEAYDLVCVASERFATSLRTEVKVPVAVLEQATDPWLFYPDADPQFARELAFVANSRKVMRRIIADLLPTQRDLAVWGTRWEGLIDERYIAGLNIPNDELRKVYSTAQIVLNDHWDDMREYGFVSNRIYDALASGGLVLSDHLPELEAKFGDAVVTYRDPAELPRLIERLLNSPQERAERAARGREIVLAEHTFAHRVDQLLGLLDEHITTPRLIRPVTGDGAAVGPTVPLSAPPRRSRRPGAAAVPARGGAR